MRPLTSQCVFRYAERGGWTCGKESSPRCPKPSSPSQAELPCQMKPRAAPSRGDERRFSFVSSCISRRWPRWLLPRCGWARSPPIRSAASRRRCATPTSSTRRRATSCGRPFGWRRARDSTKPSIRLPTSSRITRRSIPRCGLCSCIPTRLRWQRDDGSPLCLPWRRRSESDCSFSFKKRAAALQILPSGSRSSTLCALSSIRNPQSTMRNTEPPAFSSRFKSRNLS